MKVSQDCIWPLSKPCLNQRVALRRRAVREGIRHDAALGLALDHVVADLAGGIQAFLDVAVLQAVLHLVVEVRPDAGEAVGLQLHADLQRVGLALVVRALLQLLHLLGDAELQLNVVADFMGDDVGLGEVARCFEAAAQLVVEGEIDVDLLVDRAIERTHRRLADAACRPRAAREQHQLRVLVRFAEALEHARPDILGVLQDARDEDLLVVAGFRRAGLLLAGAAGQAGNVVGRRTLTCARCAASAER